MEDLVEIKTFNLQKMCRSCLQESGEDMYDIFNFQQMSIFLYQILQSISPLQIDTNDGMPNKICKDCCEKANSAYMFKLSLESSDSTLREYLFKDDSQEQEKTTLENTDYLLNMKREIAEIAFVDADPFVIPEEEEEEDLNSMDYNDDPDDGQAHEDSGGTSDDEEDYIPEEGVAPGEHKFVGTGQAEYLKEADGKYLCLLCNKKLCDKKGLHLHRRLHTGEKLKTCNICQRGFIKSDHLKRHLQIHERSISCEYCTESFNNKHDYKTHIREEHFDDHENEKTKKKPVKKSITSPSKSSSLSAICKICDKRFLHIASLRLHLTQHGQEDSFDDIDLRNRMYLFDPTEMDIEKMQASTDDELIVYIKAKINDNDNERLYQVVAKNGQELMLSDSESEEDETDQEGVKKFYNCSKCVKIFKRSKDTMDHFNEEHLADLQDVPDKCATCSSAFPNTILLFKHLKSQCESKTKKFTCGVCNTKFMWIDSLAKHTEVEHPGVEKVKMHSCDLCGKSFGRAEHMERHRKTHNPGEKKFECTICKKKFNRKDNLRSHMKIHKDNREDEDKHLCIYCGRSFSNSSNLIVHMRRHTGEKPYRCDLCEKGFPRSSDLQCHRRTHTGEKPCLCTICGKGFSRSNKLVRHMRIHTGIRPYQCTYCDRAFTQSNDLTLHIRRHTGEKPYVCGVCGDRFIQGTALKQHQRMQGHFEGTQPSPYSAISVNNPSRFTNSNLVNRRYMEQQAAGGSGTPGTIKPVIPRRRAAANAANLQNQQQNLMTSPSSSAVIANLEPNDGIIMGSPSPNHSASTTPQMALQMDDVKPNIQNMLPQAYNFMPHLLSNHLPNPEIQSFLTMSFNQNFSNSN